MNEVVKRTNTQEVPSGVLAVIEKAALNPDVDVAKMEKLLEMQERIIAKQAYHDYCASFAKMQAELPEVVERKKAHNSKYAPLEDIIEQVKPILQKHGFAVSFKIKQNGNVTITAVLMHEGGHSESTEITLPNDTSGSKNVVQAIGSSTSYGKRYALCAILNIATRDEDDNAMGAGGYITLDQAVAIDKLIAKVKANKAKFLDYMEVKDVQSIPASDYKKAINSLEAKGKK